MIDVIVEYASVALGILSFFGMVALFLIFIVGVAVVIDCFFEPDFDDDLDFEEVDYEKV